MAFSVAWWGDFEAEITTPMQYQSSRLIALIWFCLVVPSFLSIKNAAIISYGGGNSNPYSRSIQPFKIPAVRVFAAPIPIDSHYDNSARNPIFGSRIIIFLSFLFAAILLFFS